MGTDVVRFLRAVVGHAWTRWTALRQLSAAVALCALLLQSPAFAAPHDAPPGFDAEFAGESAFLTLHAGDAAQLQVFFANTGSITWSRGTSTEVVLSVCVDTPPPQGFRCNVLSPYADFNLNWTSPRIYAVPTQLSVSPGAIATFVYGLRVPPDAAPGDYYFRGELVHRASLIPVHPVGYYQIVTVIPGTAAPIVDQFNLVSQGNLVINSLQSVGQSFTVSRSGRLVGIEVAALNCSAQPADVLTLEVRQGAVVLGNRAIAANALPGPGQCGVIPTPLNMTAAGPGYFDLGALNLSVLAGQSYSFKLTDPTVGEFRVGFSPDVYSGGTAFVNDSPFAYDLAFKIVIAAP